MATRSPLVPASDPADAAPASSTDSNDAAAPAVASTGGDTPITASDRAAHDNRFLRMKAALEKQEKVEVRLQEETTVMLNGFGFHIQGKVRVKVPRQVAEVLEEAGRI